MKIEEYQSPCGRMAIGIHGDGICLCDWIIGDRVEKTLRRINKFAPSLKVKDDDELLRLTIQWLDEYFMGERKDFDVRTDLYGTEFQCRVWEALKQVGYGHTASYREIANMVSMPGGVRAVASAIGANPMSILIPCHRIIGSDGSLTGYAGGIEAKRYLLTLESNKLVDGGIIAKSNTV